MQLKNNIANHIIQLTLHKKKHHSFLATQNDESKKAPIVPIGTTKDPFFISTYQLFLWNKKHIYKILAPQNIN